MLYESMTVGGFYVVFPRVQHLLQFRALAKASTSSITCVSFHTKSWRRPFARTRVWMGGWVGGLVGVHAHVCVCVCVFAFVFVCVWWLVIVSLYACARASVLDCFCLSLPLCISLCLCTCTSTTKSLIQIQTCIRSLLCVTHVLDTIFSCLNVG